MRVIIGACYVRICWAIIIGTVCNNIAAIITTTIAIAITITTTITITITVDIGINIAIIIAYYFSDESIELYFGQHITYTDKHGARSAP